MYIHELTVRNYMIHRSSHIKLSPITVLIGPNGGGKSALFDAILNFSMHLSEFFPGLRFGTLYAEFGDWLVAETARRRMRRPAKAYGSANGHG